MRAKSFGGGIEVYKGDEVDEDIMILPTLYCSTKINDRFAVREFLDQPACASTLKVSTYNAIRRAWLHGDSENGSTASKRGPSTFLKVFSIASHQRMLPFITCIWARAIALANPPALSHPSLANTSPARDTSAPPLHTSHKPRCGRRNVPPVPSSTPRCKRLRRNPS